jgi:integrase
LYSIFRDLKPIPAKKRGPHLSDTDNNSNKTTTEIIPLLQGSTLELALAAWLAAKSKRSNSSKTAHAYQETIQQFRAALQKTGLDLDGPSAAVAIIAQEWAGWSTTPDKQVEAATYNQRLAILSSFYNYARKQGLLQNENPIGRVERRPIQNYGQSHALEYSEVKAQLAAIDRTLPEGKRDHVLLSVAIQTGRRLSELASLRRGDLHISSDTGKITLHWRRTKGGKTMSDTLTPTTSRALMEYLFAQYGAELGTLPNSAPVWVSRSRRNPGEALGIQAIADICKRRLGVSKVHSLRHTFARAMEDAGAKVSDIQAKLGHTNLATTGKYLTALKKAENQHSEALAKLFGLE